MKSLLTPASTLGILLALVSVVPRAEAICCPLPCVQCDITSRGQLNFVIFDRDAGTVRMIPNIRFAGRSADFALVVPTPALPALEGVNDGLWNQAERATQPLSGNGSSTGGLSCSAMDSQPVYAPSTDDVIVYGTVQVGGMLATILSSTNADTLVTWLNGNGYRVRTEDAARFRPYIERQWFFTAMRPDPADTQHEMPDGGWNTNVSPVAFTWHGDRFELPLQILDINRAHSLPMLLYVVDEHRADVDGFVTQYANHLDRSEFEAIQDRYPSLARHLYQGAWFTRLTRTFEYYDVMDRSLTVERAAKDEEYRRTSWSVYFGDAGLLAMAALGVLASGLRERTRAARVSRGSDGGRRSGGDRRSASI